MANHDYVINNGTGSAVRADINSALQAITTTNSGNSAPSTVAAGQLWWDSDGNTLYIRNTADNAWIEVATAYETGTWTGTLTGSTTNPSSAVTSTGNYTKVGRLYYVNITFAGVNSTGAAGGIRVTGLPATPSGSQMTGNMSVHTGATIASGTVNVSPYFESAHVSFYGSKSVAAWAEITHNATGAMWLYFSGTYKV